jgi:hypothetical protein
MLKSDTIPRLVLSDFRVYGPKQVVRVGEEKWTFVDLWTYARWASIRLLELGFEAGGLVVVADVRPMLGIALCFGGLCAGGVAFVGKWHDALKNMEQFPCVAVFHGFGKGELVRDKMGLSGQCRKKLLFIEEPVEPPPPPRRGLESLKDEEPIEKVMSRVGPDSDAILTLTNSEQTSLLTEKQVLGLAREVVETLGLGENDRIVAVTPPEGSFGLLRALLPAMIAQSLVVFAKGTNEFEVLLKSTLPTAVILGKEESDACLEVLTRYLEQRISGWDKTVLERLNGNGFLSSLARFAYEKGLSSLNKRKGELRFVALENKACVNNKAQRLLEVLGIRLEFLPSIMLTKSDTAVLVQ